MKSKGIMAVSRLVVVGCLAMAGSGSAAPNGTARDFTAWPFITVRQAGNLPRVVDYARLHAKYPGSCDEFWLSGLYYQERGERDRIVAEIGRTAEAVERLGVAAGYQQGITLNHDFPAPTEMLAAMDADCYQVDVTGASTHRKSPDGKTTWGMVCPRSPKVLQVEEEYAEQLVRLGKVRSIWLDDDLRLGYCKFKAEGCWCDRCVKALNEKAGTKMTREEWVRRLSDQTVEKDPLRAVWSEFKGESLAMFAAAARRGAKRADPKVRMALQAISSDSIHCGFDYGPILAALSDGFREPVGIRAGHGCWQEGDMRWALPQKLLGVAREAERCRRYPGWKGTITYEEENYPRHLLQKTPETSVREAALAIAAGCDAVSTYYYNSSSTEPLEYYEDFARTLAAWRPYLERLASVVPGTHLGGIARKPDPDLMLGCDNTIPALQRNDDGLARRARCDTVLAQIGIPVTVAESGVAVWYDAKEDARFHTSSANERAAFLDRMDRKPGGPVCVRVDKLHWLGVYPRVNGHGRTVAVTFVNLALGRTERIPVRVRRPLAKRAHWVRPCAPDAALELKAGEGDEVRFTLPDLGAWEMATVFFAEVGGEGAAK